MRPVRPPFPTGYGLATAPLRGRASAFACKPRLIGGVENGGWKKKLNVPCSTRRRPSLLLGRPSPRHLQDAATRRNWPGQPKAGTGATRSASEHGEDPRLAGSEKVAFDCFFRWPQCRASQQLAPEAVSSNTREQPVACRSQACTATVWSLVETLA